MTRRFVLPAAALSLSLAGCAAALPWAVASGGVLTGVAAVTNADVNLAKAYIDWRGASSTAAKPTVGPTVPPAPAATN